MHPGAIPTLEVDRDALLSALRLLSRRTGGKAKGQEATLRFEEGELVIGLGDLEAGAAANGHWPGTALIGAHVLRALTSVLQDADSALLTIQDGRLRVGTFGVACVWTAHCQNHQSASENPDRTHIAPAELTTKIDMIADLLAPYEISHDSVREWVLDAVLGEQHDSPLFSATQPDLDLRVPGEQINLGEE